ncbi:MAG: hypothetical protein IJ408_06485 [Clostridia bacterium]|nr:hypothetical protein [Clostridia bacterium]
MKKRLFNGNIKQEYVSYVGLGIIVAAVVFFGCGALFLGCSLSGLVEDQVVELLLLIFGVILVLFGLFYTFGTIFVIRTYPKHQKYVKYFLNSEIYFVGCESEEYYGSKKGRKAFNVATRIAQQEKRYKGIRYPQKMKIYTVFAAIGIVLCFLYIGVLYVTINKIELLPIYLQNENLIFGIFIFLYALTMFISIFCAFRVRRIRKETKMKFERGILND